MSDSIHYSAAEIPQDLMIYKLKTMMNLQTIKLPMKSLMSLESLIKLSLDNFPSRKRFLSPT